MGAYQFKINHFKSQVFILAPAPLSWVLLNAGGGPLLESGSFAAIN